MAKRTVKDLVSSTRKIRVRVYLDKGEVSNGDTTIFHFHGNVSMKPRRVLKVSEGSG